MFKIKWNLIASSPPDPTDEIISTIADSTIIGTLIIPSYTLTTDTYYLINFTLFEIQKP